jgi:hypothetical protein
MNVISRPDAIEEEVIVSTASRRRNSVLETD